MRQHGQQNTSAKLRVTTRVTRSGLYQKRQAGSEWGQEGFTAFVGAWDKDSGAQGVSLTV